MTAAAQQFTTPQGGTLSLSLDEAVARALENNADIAVERFNPELSAQDVRGAEGYYDPFLFATLTKSSTDTKGTNLFSGGSTVNTKTGLWNFGVQRAIQTGASYSVGFNNNKRDTNNAFSTFNPVYNSSLAFNLTQPLLKNFGIDRPRLNLKLAKKGREITDVQFRQTVINTVATAKGFYYELLYAIDNLAAAQKNLQLAKKLLEENEIRVKVGTMAPLDVVTAQSEVASREEGVIVAENSLAEAEDNLKRVIFPLNDPLMWRTRIAPTDRPSAEPMPVDIDAAVRTALENRTDMVAARKNLERSDYSLAFAKNQLRPQLDLVANYGGIGRRRDPDPGRGGQSPADADPRWLRRRGLRGVRLRLPDLDGRLQRLVRDPQPQRQGQRGDGPVEQGPDAGVLQAPRAAGRGRGADRRARRRFRLQARRLEPGGAPARRRAARRRGEEVRRGHVHELLRHAGAARPGPGRGERAARDRRLPQERHQLPARPGSRRRRPGRGTRPERRQQHAQGGQAILSGAASSSGRTSSSPPRRGRGIPEGGQSPPSVFVYEVFTGREPDASTRPPRPGLNWLDMAFLGRRLVWVLLGALALGAGYWMLRGRTAPARFTTGSVDRGDVVEVVGATGTLEAVVTVQLGSQVSGTIDSLHADFNSTVKKGQVVARLDPSLFEARLDQARANLLAARANVDRARSTVEDMRQKYERAKELAAEKLLPVSDLETAKANSTAPWHSSRRTRPPRARRRRT